MFKGFFYLYFKCLKQASSQLGSEFCITLELRFIVFQAMTFVIWMNENMGNKGSDPQFGGKFATLEFSKCSSLQIFFIFVFVL